jgi:hypothetical protein
VGGRGAARTHGGHRRRPPVPDRGQKVLAGDFRGSPTQITLAVKAVQTLRYWTRDPFGTTGTVTNP